MNEKKICNILSLMYKKNPKPTVGLLFNSDFELLISLILSPRSTDISVNKITKKIFDIARTPYKIYSIGINNLKTYIKTIGLYNKKSSNIIQTCKIIIEKYNGKIPNNRKDLENLPGVGRKISNIFLNVLHNLPLIAVDTHVLRVSNRLGLTNSTNTKIVESKLTDIVPLRYKMNLHNLFVSFGKKICYSRKPKCKICFLYVMCEYKNKNY